MMGSNPPDLSSLPTAAPSKGDELSPLGATNPAAADPPTPAIVTVDNEQRSPLQRPPQPASVPKASTQTDVLKSIFLTALLAAAVALPFAIIPKPSFVEPILLCFLPAAVGFIGTLHFLSVVSPVHLWDAFVLGWLVLLPAAFTMTAVVVAIAVCVADHVEVPDRLQGGAVTAVFLCITLVSVGAAETGKYLLLRGKDSLIAENPKRVVLCSLFTALGLATGESYYLVLLHSIRFWNGAARLDDELSFAFLCVGILVPMHVLSGYHIGLRVAHRALVPPGDSTARLLSVPFVFRWAFMFLAVWVPAITERYWLSFLALPLVPVYIYVVRRDELRMPRTYLNRAGYMNAFGYGLLADSDSAEAPATATEMESRNDAVAVPAAGVVGESVNAA